MRAALVAVLAFAASSCAMYEDQVGQLDWHKENIGRVTVARSQQPKGRLLFVGSDAGAVAAVNVRTGELVWRRVLPDGEAVEALEATKNSVVTVSGDGTHVRCWEPQTGAMKWEAVLPGDGPATPHTVSMIGPTLVVLRGDTAYSRRLSAKDSTTTSYTFSGVVWGAAADGDGNFCVVSAAGGVTVDCFEPSELTAASTHVFDTRAVAVAAVPTTAGLAAVALAVDGSVTLLRPDGSTSDVDLGGDTVSSLRHLEVSATGDVSDAAPVVLELSSGGAVVLGVTASSTFEAGRTPPSPSPLTFAAASSAAGVMVAALQPEGGALVVAMLASVTPGGAAAPADAFPVVHLGTGSPIAAGITDLFLFGFTRSKSGDVLLRALIVAGDDTLSLAQQGQIVWDRQEYLASLTQVVSVDAPGRVAEHALDKLFIGLAVLRGGATKLVAFESATGAIVWETAVEVDVVPSVTTLHDSRAHAFDARHNPEVMLITKRTAVGEGAGDPWATRVRWVDAFTGATTREEALAVVARQVSSPPSVSDSYHRRAVLVVGDDASVTIVPRTPAVVDAFEATRQSFVLRVGAPGDAALSGNHLVPAGDAPGTYAMQPLWTLALGANMTLAAVEQPLPSEPVAGPAVVLGDDTLFTKYLNPNLLGVIAASDGPYGAVDATLEVRLVDSVSGRVLVSQVHKHASGPTHAVRQEHWFVYTYWNTKAKRTEVGAVSLYEDSIRRFELNPLKPPPEQAPFSSFAASDPIVLSKSFVLPAAVSALALSRTRFGITTPHLLFGVHPGSVYALNRALLDPRRPVGPPTEADKREQLMQYQPFLPVVHQHVVTYNHTVPRLRAIHTAPTALESTTLVLAVGLDLFYTPATPAGAFDVLAPDFNKPLLAILTGGLVVLTIVLGALAKRKRLNMRWA